MGNVVHRYYNSADVEDNLLQISIDDSCDPYSFQQKVKNVPPTWKDQAKETYETLVVASLFAFIKNIGSRQCGLQNQQADVVSRLMDIEHELEAKFQKGDIDSVAPFYVLFNVLHKKKHEKLIKDARTNPKYSKEFTERLGHCASITAV